MKPLKECKTPDDFIVYAMYNKDITNDEIKICLDAQVTPFDFRMFAKYVNGLLPEHIDICIDKQKNLENLDKFTDEVHNLTPEQRYFICRITTILIELRYGHGDGARQKIESISIKDKDALRIYQFLKAYADVMYYD